MRTQSADTSPEAERVQIALLREMTPAQRIGIMRAVSRRAIALSRRALRRAHPAFSESELRLAFIGLHYGRDVANQVWAVYSNQNYQEVPMDAADILTILTPVVEVCEQLGIFYYIGGSVAGTAFGIARSTVDVDVVADIRVNQIHAFAEKLRNLYYVDEQMIRDAILHKTSFNLIHLGTSSKVDVFILKPRAFDQEAALRVQKDTLDEAADAREFNLASPEDLILAKLEWYTMGGGVSDRQWGDILGIMKVQAGALDLAYLRHWAAELAIAEALERALVDAGLTEESDAPDTPQPPDTPTS